MESEYGRHLLIRYGLSRYELRISSRVNKLQLNPDTAGKLSGGELFSGWEGKK